MEDTIEILRKRYGAFDYNHLTEVQKAFLLDPKIKDNGCGAGALTVSIETLTEAMVSIEDHYSYEIRNKRKGVGNYDDERNPIYQQLSGDNNPQRTGFHEYRFTLEDNSNISVKFRKSYDGGV